MFIAPGKGRETMAYVATLGSGAAPRHLLTSDGNPEKLRECRWASNTRIVCRIFVEMEENLSIVGYWRWIALDADGTRPQLLSAPSTARALGVAQAGGSIIDWESGKEGSILMTRVFVPDMNIGTRLANERRGYGVERVDTNSLQRSIVEAPKEEAVEFISDGRGNVRVMGSATKGGPLYDRGIYAYFYRKSGEETWLPLSTRNLIDETGFAPLAVDPTLNAVYGIEQSKGRYAIFRIALDGSLKRELVLERPDVDVDGLIRIGRRQRVVGVSYATDRRELMFFDPQLKSLAGALSRALPGLPLINFVDSSEDETKLLLWAGSDVDPGRYYLFDRTARKLDEIMLSRPPLENAKLAPVKPVTFPAADGTQIPGYLTLPPGSDARTCPRS
ncbi:MAG: hypothetical protein WDN24_10320 [Sphingomonas sp.]